VSLSRLKKGGGGGERKKNKRKRERIKRYPRGGGKTVSHAKRKMSAVPNRDDTATGKGQHHRVFREESSGKEKNRDRPILSESARASNGSGRRIGKRHSSRGSRGTEEITHAASMTRSRRWEKNPGTTRSWFYHKKRKTARIREE